MGGGVILLCRMWKIIGGGMCCSSGRRFYIFRKMPDFPFPENDCPLCKRWHQYLDITVEDIAKLDISILRKAIAIKKSIKGNNHDNK